jgi:hypothetical protein
MWKLVNADLKICRCYIKVMIFMPQYSWDGSLAHLGAFTERILVSMDERGCLVFKM